MTSGAVEAVSLKACPFCGGPSKMIHPMGIWQGESVGYGPDGSRIACTNKACTVYSPAFHGEHQDAEAIAWWNTRATPSDQEKLISELREALAEMHSAILGKPVGGGDGSTFMMGYPSMQTMNKANALLKRTEGSRT